MKERQIPTEADRLEKYFAKLEREISWISDAELEEVMSRPCKWAKILEERKDNPDVSGEW